MAKNKEDKFSLEQNIKSLRKIVEQMQSGDLDFDKNVGLFQDGAKIIRECREYLDRSELMIKELLDSGEEKDFGDESE